jgi:hypothetical protein
MKITPCQIPHLKLSCYGCCGRNFTSKKEIKKDIKVNTSEFLKIKIPSTLRLLQFRDRFSEDPSDLTPSGICSNLVDFGNGLIACPLHKYANKLISKDKLLRLNKKDLRFNHCDINCKCETFIFWEMLTENQKDDYIKWLSNKSYDLHEYSTKNLKGEIIRKFLDEKEIKFF